MEFWTLIAIFGASIIGLVLLGVVAKYLGVSEIITAMSTLFSFIWEFVKIPVKFVLDHAPKPMKIVLFLVFFGLVGNVLFNATLGTTYVCNPASNTVWKADDVFSGVTLHIMPMKRVTMAGSPVGGDEITNLTIFHTGGAIDSNVYSLESETDEDGNTVRWVDLVTPRYVTSELSFVAGKLVKMPGYIQGSYVVDRSIQAAWDWTVDLISPGDDVKFYICQRTDTSDYLAQGTKSCVISPVSCDENGYYLDLVTQVGGVSDTNRVEWRKDVGSIKYVVAQDSLTSKVLRIDLDWPKSSECNEDQLLEQNVVSKKLLTAQWDPSFWQKIASWFRRGDAEVQQKELLVYDYAWSSLRYSEELSALDSSKGSEQYFERQLTEVATEYIPGEHDFVTFACDGDDTRDVTMKVLGIDLLDMRLIVLMLVIGLLFSLYTYLRR